MTKLETRTGPVPQDALYQLATEKDYPDADLLERVIKKYPGHAGALTRLAIDIAIDRLVDAESSCDEEDDEDLSLAVSRAISRFENALFDEQSTADMPTPFETKAARSVVTPVNPFSGLETKDFRAFSKRMGANTIFAVKLRDCQIDVSTMTPGFIAHAAMNLPTEQSIMLAHLSAPSNASSAGSFNKADDKPTSGGRQSLEDAVRSSHLSVEQQVYLLGL